LYRRWTASALERLALAQAAGGDRSSAAASVDQSVNILLQLYKEWPNEARLRDLQKALTAAIRTTEDWKQADPALRERWVGLNREIRQ
jgi:hypothetical protein